MKQFLSLRFELDIFDRANHLQLILTIVGQEEIYNNAGGIAINTQFNIFITTPDVLWFNEDIEAMAFLRNMTVRDDPSVNADNVQYEHEYGLLTALINAFYIQGEILILVVVLIRETMANRS